MLRPYAFVCAPPRLSGYLSFVTAPPTPTERPALPGLRLPLGRRRLGTGAVVSVVAHGLIIVLLIVRGRELLQRLPGALGRGGGGEERAGRPQINFFTLPAAGPTAVDVPAVPADGVAHLLAPPPLEIGLPPPPRPRAPPPPRPGPRAAPARAGAGGGR